MIFDDLTRTDKEGKINQANTQYTQQNDLTMSEIAALLLCKLGGKAGSADDIKAVLEAAGAEANDDAISKLTGDMEGKDINDLLAAGMDKLKDVPMGGGGGG